MKFSKVAGRTAIYVPDHPKVNNRGYILYSRYLMEQHLGRYLSEDEEVHHKDDDCSNDDFDNLQLTTSTEHPTLMEEKLKKRKLDYQAIRELREQGFGSKRIAKALGYSRASVQSAIKYMQNDLAQ